MSTQNFIFNIEDVIKEVTSANAKDSSFTIENIIYAGKTEEMRRIIDQIFIQSGLGSVKSGITKNLYGINFAGTPNMLPINRDHYGLTFFSRPCMNFMPDNLRSNRIMSQLLNNDVKSVHRLIRSYLDPRIFDNGGKQSPGWGSPFVNPKSPFIALLSNNLLSMSGWPDYDAQIYTSTAGNWREEYSFVDGIIQDFRTWDATCSFRNIDGNIIVNLFFYWLIYQACVAVVGDMIPYPVMNLCHEIDYNTAIWRITLDPTRTRLTGIARTISYPITCPIGAQFNFESEQEYNKDYDQVSIQFKCHGAEYNDDILIDEFNRLVQLFDPDFTEKTRQGNYIRLPPSAYRIFNGLAQPRINPNTYDMEWWVPKSEYDRYKPLLMQSYSSAGKVDSLDQQIQYINGTSGSSTTNRK